jgi:hypothetical protein
VGISRVTWASKNLFADIREFANAELSPKDYVGAWGLLHFGGTSWFQDPKLVIVENDGE